MNLEQSIVLLLFNEFNELCFNDMIEKTNMEEEKINNILSSLLNSKLLIKFYDNTDINIDKLDNKNKYKYKINNNFDSDEECIFISRNLNKNKKTSTISQENKIFIYKFLSENNNISFENLYNLLEKDNNIKIDKEQLKLTLIDFKNIDMVENKNDKWLIKESDSETSDSSD